MTSPRRRPPSRAEVVAILAAMGERAPDEVSEEISSLEVAWLVSQVEDRYHTTLELNDDELARMMTVSGAVATIHQMLDGAADG